MRPMASQAAPERRQVFISHAAGDRGFAREMAAELARAGLTSWLSDEVLPGENALLKMGQALEAADALVVLLSPEAAASPNLAYEVQYATGAERFANRVVPVMVRPTTEMPWILERFGVIPATGGAKRVARRVADRLASPAGV